MWRVARQAPLCLDWSVLVYEWSARLRVALGADCILVGCGLDVVVSKGAVHIMTVAALYQPLIYPVVKRHIERRLHVGVAPKAKCWLRSLKQRFPVAFGVHAVATHTTHAGLRMRRTIEVGMRSRMATQALGIHIPGRGLSGIEDLGHVPTASHVLTACPVAVLAGHSIVAVHQRHFGVRVIGESLYHLFVARSADFRAYKLGMNGYIGSGSRFGARIGFRRLSSERSSTQANLYALKITAFDVLVHKSGAVVPAPAG